MSFLQDNILKNLPKGLQVSRERLSGWGRYAYVDCVVVSPKNLDELRDLLTICAANQYSITPKGSGCSFGDIITNGQGVVLDLTSWDKIIRFDSTTGILTTQGGTSAGKVLHHTLPHHWVLRGLPGTSFGTMSGLIANNVHGKDSFKNGNFGMGVLSMQILLADGRVVRASANENADVFYATIGGMGLLGIIIEATLQLIKIPGSMVEIERKYFNSIPELFDLFTNLTDDFDMDMGWFDGFHKKGRGIFQTAKWLNQDPEITPPSMESVGKKFMGKIPIGLVYPLVKPFACRTSMRALNQLAYWGSKTSKDKKILHLYSYYYPHMISIPDSPKAIRGGLVGFQLIAPDEKACEFITNILALCRRYKLESWFGGIKRLRSDPFLMSFAEDGYAITVEIPGRFTKWRRFPSFLDEMVALTIDYKGKIFLGKDSLLKPAHIRAMYPKLPDFLAVRQKMDPHKIFGSDLSRRLFL